MIKSVALNNISLSITDLIGRCWDPAFNGTCQTWPVTEGSNSNSSLKVSQLHYPKVIDWIYFKNTIAQPGAKEAFARMIKGANKSKAVIGSYEGGTDFSFALKQLSAGLDLASKIHQRDAFFYFACNHGLGSEHAYLQVDFIDPETEKKEIERLVYVFVHKNHSLI